MFRRNRFDVVPCDFLHVGLGNVFRNSIAEIRANALRIDWFREYNALCLACNDRDFQALHLRKMFAAEKDPVPLDEAGSSVPPLYHVGRGARARQSYTPSTYHRPVPSR